MHPRSSYYFSSVRLSLATSFLAVGEICFIAFTIFMIPEHPFLAFLGALAASLSIYPLIILGYRLGNSSKAALRLESEKLVIAVGLHEEEVQLSQIKSVSLLKPTSEGIGKTLHIELHGAYEGSQWRLRTLSIPLALISASGSKLVEEITFRAENAQATNPSIERTSNGLRPLAASHVKR